MEIWFLRYKKFELEHRSIHKEIMEKKGRCFDGQLHMYMMDGRCGREWERRKEVKEKRVEMEE